MSIDLRKINPQAVQAVRAEHSSAPRFSADNTHEAVIVETVTPAGGKHIGVQYWMSTQMLAGIRTNYDRSVSSFIERLYI